MSWFSRFDGGIYCTWPGGKYPNNFGPKIFFFSKVAGLFKSKFMRTFQCGKQKNTKL